MDNLLPSLGKLKNSSFEEASLAFRKEKLVQLIFNSLIGIESFTIQMVLKEGKQMVIWWY